MEHKYVTYIFTHAANKSFMQLIDSGPGSA